MRKPFDSIEIPVWWTRGDGMSFRRDCLPEDHPESELNYMLNVLKINPEEYGYTRCPRCEKYYDSFRYEFKPKVKK